MLNLSQILRVLALSILFGGSSSIVFVAVSLVKEAKARGIPASEAATANAPIFLQFATLILVCAIVLGLARLVLFAKDKTRNLASNLALASDSICVILGIALCLVIIPPMKELLPQIAANADAHARFHSLHEQSRLFFGGIILLSLVSLVIPSLEKLKQDQS